MSADTSTLFAVSMRYLYVSTAVASSLLVYLRYSSDAGSLPLMAASARNTLAPFPRRLGKLCVDAETTA